MYIDAHVHLRDFKEADLETIEHGLEVARDSGVDAVFDMPNTDPAIFTRDLVVERLRLAKNANVPEVLYGLYVGLTADIEQVKQAVDIHREFPQVIGMKLYAGHSVRNIGVTKLEDQLNVYKTLANEGYDGVLAVHCEKESEMDSTLWNPSFPISHCHARPEKAEVESVKDQIDLATKTNFQGGLHIPHISSPRAVDLVYDAKQSGLDISSGICPHHFIYDWSQMDSENGILWKMNPPLRNPESREEIFKYLREGKIDWIETDHAPHTLDKKLNDPHLSGIPGLAWWPLFEEYLKQHNFTDNKINDLTYSNILNRFGLDIKKTRRTIKDRRQDYPFDSYKIIADELIW